MKHPLEVDYAFCDQDDIWLENKLIKAISKIVEDEKVFVSISHSEKYAIAYVVIEN